MRPRPQRAPARRPSFWSTAPGRRALLLRYGNGYSLVAPKLLRMCLREIGLHALLVDNEGRKLSALAIVAAVGQRVTTAEYDRIAHALR